jgi:hypothetical protein
MGSAGELPATSSKLSDGYALLYVDEIASKPEGQYTSLRYVTAKIDAHLKELEQAKSAPRPPEDPLPPAGPQIAECTAMQK